MTAAVILAGGLGTRLHSTVPDWPKPMAPTRGRPFLEHLMDYWIGQGIDRMVLSVCYKRDLIMNHFGAAYRGVPIRYAIEEEPLGTGGGLLLAAQQELSVPFLVLNGDTFFAVDLADLAAHHRARGAHWTFALFLNGDTKRYMGMDVADDGAIRSLAPSSDKAGQLANGGVYLVEPAALQATSFTPGARLSLEYELLPAVVQAGCRLYGVESRGIFIDIGVPDDYWRAAEILP